VETNRIIGWVTLFFCLMFLALVFGRARLGSHTARRLHDVVLGSVLRSTRSVTLFKYPSGTRIGEELVLILDAPGTQADLRVQVAPSAAPGASAPVPAAPAGP